MLIISPRDHGKSSQISVARVLYELGRNPNLRIKVVAQSDERSSDILSEIKEHLEKNTRLHEVFPHLRKASGKQWTQHKVFIERELISKDPSVAALGVLSTATGARADLIIFDDIVDFRNAIQNPKLRDVVREAFFSVWINLLEPTGRLVYICTLWHQDDLSHLLISMDAYHTINYSIPDGSFEPIWEAQWNEERLRRRCEEIGQREFDRSFRNIALSSDETLFPRHIIEQNFVSVEEAPAGLKCYGGVDLASGQGKKAKFNVFFTLAIDRDGKRWRKEIIRGKFTSPQFARVIVKAFDKHQHELIFVENNAYQSALVEWLGEIGRKDLPIQGFTTGKNKLDLQVGLPSLALEFENAMWAIPRMSKHAVHCKCNTCIWIKEMEMYPIGATSDILMACWMAREAVRKGSRQGGTDLW